VLATQEAIRRLPGYAWVKPSVESLVQRYIRLQVAKHGPPSNRVAALMEAHREEGPASRDLFWWEHAAATGSTLGIFALLSRALATEPASDLAALQDLYFPWMSALHILLDYFVDQEEDRLHGDLNFIAHYPSVPTTIQRLHAILTQVIQRSRALGDGAFHRYVARGLLGFYLSDRKVRHHFLGAPCRLLGAGGAVSLAVYLLALRARSP
jgi:tetraprenyl-beta-curcumene synthase